MQRILYLLIVFVLVSCSNKKPEANQNYLTTPSGLEGIQKSNAAIAPIQQTDGSMKLNPPHGQPGHNCDLAVGAPLKSTNILPSTPPTITTQVPVPTGTSNKKLNPAHGQPGHKCELPVGAPLT